MSGYVRIVELLGVCSILAVAGWAGDSPRYVAEGVVLGPDGQAADHPAGRWVTAGAVAAAGVAILIGLWQPWVGMGEREAVTTPTTEAANTGLEASQLLWTGDDPISWDSVSWNSVSWNSVSWNSVSWNSVSWNSVSWNSVSWDD
mgnify:CR=1 FL=1